MTQKHPLFSCSVDFQGYAAESNAGCGIALRVKASPALAGKIRRVIEKKRLYLEKRLLANLRKPAKTQSEIASSRSALPEYIRENISPFLSYLQQFFRTCDETWLLLYAGEKLRLVEDPSLPSREREQEIEDLLERDRRCFIRALRNHAPSEAVLLFEQVLDAVAILTSKRGGRELRLLLVGDCLFTDVVDFLRPKCAGDGVSIVPVRITSKNPIETREELIKYSKEKFDAVFFSPFTYEYSREYAWFLSWKSGSLRADEFEHLVDEVIRQTRETIDILASYYDCSILVHNCSGLRRWEKNWALETFKQLRTSRKRRTAKQAINRWLSSYVEEKNTATFDHVFILDEAGFVATLGERTLRQYIFHGGSLHTAVFGKILANFYQDIVFALAYLKSKKLVICDLDNTLWRGVIGEGSVVPLGARQECLQQLKKKGVLLAVCSKNNPSDVHWDGNLCGPSDFVASRINWDPKAHNLRSLESELKLKRKDFVFLDDSPLEREMIASTFPEVAVLDPEEDRTWRIFELWKTLLGSGSSEDRTAYYHKDKERSRAIEPVAAAGDLLGALSSLQIRITLREAERSDLQRAVELVNRTNQFNLCGTRTTFREMQAWLNSPDHKILIGQAEDKFGSMGTVCIAVAQTARDAVEIPVFVLSCRVIGYGIESAMLNYIRMLAENDNLAPKRPVVGRLKLTPHNEPCRQMYSSNGFELDADGNWRSSSREIQVPSWLAVDYGLPLTR